MKKVLVVCLVGVALCAAATGKETKLTVEDNGVLGAMARMGCGKIFWLAETLRESNLVDAELGKLLEGTRIVVPDACPGVAPNSEDVAAVREIFAAQQSSEKNQPQPQSTKSVERAVKEQVPDPAISLRRELAAKAEELEAARRAIAELKVQAAAAIAAANAAKEQAKKAVLPANQKREAAVIPPDRKSEANGGGCKAADHQAPPAPPKNSDAAETAKHEQQASKLIAVSVLAVFSVLLLGIVMFLAKRQLNFRDGRIVSLEGVIRERDGNIQTLRAAWEAACTAAKPLEGRTWSIRYGGQLVEFENTSEYFAGCPHCSESRLKPDTKNLRQHLDKHPALRLRKGDVHDFDGVEMFSVA